MNCPSCGSSVPAEANFCPGCALPLDEAGNAATRRLETPRSTPQKPPSFSSFDNERFVPGTMLAERYRIVGLLGKGGMGEVFRADDIKLGQPVALKFLPDHLLHDGAALARFHREVRVARQVSHKNVCRVYDIGEIDGRHFLSMEFIKGEELSSLLRRIGRLPADKAIEIARQICAGLAAAHDAGILHRDLKPSNVMIDEQGNARITDFGLAGLVEEFGDEELAAGTPAYMSPEQLDGSEQTVKSDIYSLGLVLYELFTGKKAFEAETIGELLSLRRSDSTPTTPTSIVKDLDPVVEKVIDRCIQKDPTQRPSSALQVAAALPGGDPLAAALAAGETPSPEMVAAAPKKGTLRPPVALALLASVVLLLGLTMVLSKHAALHRQVPFPKPPDVLKEQASQLAASFGYSNIADDTQGFRSDHDYYFYLSDRRNGLNPWVVLKESQPAAVHFWYRQSPAPLVAYNSQRVDWKDPPSETPGMVRISLDTEGKLFYFEAVPEPDNSNHAVRSDTAGKEKALSDPAASRGPEFDVLFRAAGLDIAQFQITEPLRTAPHGYDERHSWAGTYPKFPQIPLRIEAASYRGRPVYFEMVSPWSKSPGLVVEAQKGEKAFIWLLLGVFFATLLFGALLALRNLKAGRGDRRGAFRVALVLFVFRMIYWIFATHHVATADETVLLVTGLQSALFWSCFVGLLYLALEPYLRRHWPQQTISWNRLVYGEFRDPLIGRDFLIGAVAGSMVLVLLYLRLLVPQWLGTYPGMPDTMDGLETQLVGIGTFVELLINQFTGSVVQVFMIVFLMLFLSLLLRRDWLGILVGFLILWGMFGSSRIGNEHPVGLATTVLFVGLVVFTATRVGPIGLLATLVFVHLWVFFPITTQLSAWYAFTFLLDVLVLLALTIYSYYISLGGQSPLNIKFLAE